MDASVVQLTQVLQKTETLYIQLLDIIDEEKKAAVAADPQQLTELNTQKQEFVQELKTLDQALAHTLQDVAVALQIPKADLKLSTVAAKAGPPHDTRIEALNARLRPLIANVQTANEECRLLIDHCLRVVRSKLGYFEHWMRDTDVYAASGSIRGENTGGRLLRGVV